MSLIIAESISHNYGTREVLKRVSFRLYEGVRVGLVGPNGEGKTTLLRIIAGNLEPSVGEVHRARSLNIGYLPQDPPSLPGTTVFQAMETVFDDCRRIERELEALAHELAARPGDEGLLNKYGEMQADLEARGGYDHTSRIEQVLQGLAFKRDMWDVPVANLSGGQRTRAYLAMLLLKNPEILLLDEPTNHLDLDSVEWLETWLQSFKGVIVVVSHDRYFLDHVTNQTWEMAFGGLQVYRAPYSQFLKLRDERRKEETRRWEEQQEYIARTQEFIRIHLAGQRTKEAQGRRTRLERFIKEEAIERPRWQETIHLRIPAGTRTGEFVFRIKGLEVGYEPGKPLVQIGYMEVQRTARIAIVGANGTGKTTLLRTLLGQLAPLDGEIKAGANVRIGYLSQTHSDLDPNMTALEAVQSAAKGTSSEAARSLLGSMLLSGDEALKKICQLSGGQRSRVVLARLAVQKVNVLALDEPTNHLDIPSTEIIQEALLNYDGTIIFISHDRYLVQALAEQIWAIDDYGISEIPGRWAGYLEWRSTRRQVAVNKEAVEQTPAREAKEQRKAQYFDQRKRAGDEKRLKRRHEEIEKSIMAAEEKISALSDAITAASEKRDVSRVEKLGREYEEKQAELKVLWEEWEDLGEKIE